MIQNSYVKVTCPWKSRGGVHRKDSLVFFERELWVTAFCSKKILHQFVTNE